MQTNGQDPSHQSLRKVKIVACDYCHSKKIKCDIERPCKRCLQKGIECTITRKHKKVPKADSSTIKNESIYLDTFEARLSGAEANFKNTQKHQELNDPDSSRGPNISIPKKNTSVLETRNLGDDKDDVAEDSDSIADKTLILPSTILIDEQLKNGINASVSPSPTNGCHFAGSSFSSDLDPILPRFDLIDLYFDNVYPAFPVLPRHIFFHYYNSLPRFYHLVIHALGTVYLESSKEINDSLGDKYMESARKLVDSHIDQPSPMIAHALYLLAAYSIVRGNSNSCWMFIGMSANMSMDLGLNKDSSVLIPELPGLHPRLQKEIKRRLWWLIYMADIFVNASNDLPTWIQEGDMEVPLSTSEEIWVTRNLDDFSRSEAERVEKEITIMTSEMDYSGGLQLTNHFAAITLATRNHGRVCAYLKSMAKFSELGTPGLMSRFYNLEASINTWKSSLPSWVRLSAGESYGNVPLSSQGPILHWNYAHLGMSYHVLRILLYKSDLIDKKGRESDVSVCPRTDGITQEDLKSRRKSSLAHLKHSAREIARLCSLFLSNNSKFLYVGPLISSCVFEAGLAWLVVLRWSETLEDDPEDRREVLIQIRKEFESDIRVLVESLENMGCYCQGSLSQAETIRGLVQGENT